MGVAVHSVRLNRAIALTLILTSSGPAFAGASRPSPLRRAVDIYNAVGTANRWIAFMKIGAIPGDTRYLNTLNAKLAGKPLPRAYLTGGSVYFRGLPEPLKVIDLRKGLFSIRGRTLNLGTQARIEAQLTGVERVAFPKRSAYFFIDWILPQAVAALDAGDPAATASAILGLSGLAANLQCLEDAKANCEERFMGALGALGEAGGFNGVATPNLMFCSPDFNGGSKVVVADHNHKILEISNSGGEYVVKPGFLETNAGEQRAAATLLKTCAAKDKLASYNIAFAYPTAVHTQPAAGALATAPRVSPQNYDSGDGGGTAQ